MNQFVSEDKMNINLPIPLGSTVYTYLTECCDICLFQKELFNKVLRKEDSGTCGVLPCHIRLHSILEKTLDFESMNVILKYWGDKYFSTEEEANNAAKNEIKINREILIDLGFEFDENWYATKKDEAV